MGFLPPSKRSSVSSFSHTYIPHMYTVFLREIVLIRPRKKYCLFPVTVFKKNKVGRLVIFLHFFFGQKCVFYACFTLIGSWEGGKNFRIGIFLDKNLLGRVTGNKQLFLCVYIYIYIYIYI